MHCISLLLLPAAVPEGVYALPQHLRAARPAKSGAEPAPYLPIAGAPPLRFQEPAPPPDLVTRPPAAAPPTPALTPTESSVAIANAAAAARTSAPANETAAAPSASPQASSKAGAAPGKTPPPILRDEARPTVRPEDFLPYFQIPGAPPNPPDVTLPATPRSSVAPLPPSTATYRQTSP